jgi:hypothetical protein
MSQKQIDYFNYLNNNNQRSISTQTGEEDHLFIHLENKKTARLYFSSAYKETVLSFNFGSSKSFIITKSMWKVFRNYIKTIDTFLNND